MFFYTALFIASVIMAIIVLWLYRSLSGAGKAVYQAILPSSKGKAALGQHLDRVAARTTVNGASTPWGWQGKTKPSQRARSANPARSTANPLGLTADRRGKPQYQVTRQRQRNVNFNRPASAMALGSQESWACRDEEFEFAGKTYKVKRQAFPEHFGKRKTDKPGGG